MSEIQTTLSHERHGKVTGSRVGAILGLDEYRTRDDVMREMVREWFFAEPEFTGNIATDWGHEHEPDAIAELGARLQDKGFFLGATGRDQQVLVHPEYDWLGVSPDGVVVDDPFAERPFGVVEVKCPFRASYTSIDERPGYHAQLTTAMACAGVERGWFGIWRPTGMVVEEVDFDADRWSDIRVICEEFLQEFRVVLADPDLYGPHLQPLVEVRTDRNWMDAAQAYVEAKATADWYALQAKAAREELVALAGGQKVRGGGVFGYPTSAGGRTSWKGAAEAAITRLKELGESFDLSRFKSGGSAATGYTIRRTTRKDSDE